MDADISLFQDRYRADDEIDAFERFHPAGANKTKRRVAAHLSALCLEAFRVDDVFSFMDRLPDLHGIRCIFAIAGDGGGSMEKAERSIGDAFSHLAVQEIQTSPPAQLLHGILLCSHPLPVEHVVEVFGHDKQRLLVKLDSEIVSEPECGIGRK